MVKRSRFGYLEVILNLRLTRFSLSLREDTTVKRNNQYFER